MKTSNQVLIEQIHRCLADQKSYTRILNDFHLTFVGIGMYTNFARDFASRMIHILRQATTIEDAENGVREMFLRIKIGKKTLFEIIEYSHQDRIERIYTQIAKDLPVEGSVLDYGCGSGRLAQKIHDMHGLTVAGADIRDFRAEGVTVPIYLIGGYTVPVPDMSFDCVLLTNVLHHDPDNDIILDEIGRITDKKLVVIETFANGDSVDSLVEEWDVVFMNDVLWNRFFNFADIPVPGTYDTMHNWIRRIQRRGFKFAYAEDYGIDQPMMRDRHMKMVFAR